MAEFVFKDDKVRRPYFSSLSLPRGLQVTRNHPPIESADATDHDTMHPGVWLAFGDISGNDFWRNKAHIEHVRFATEPRFEAERLSFTTECYLKTNEGKPLCLLNNHITLAVRPAGWLLIWDATFQATSQTITFGDQEEMGFGARVATPIIEKNGGRILNSAGQRTAKQTWGQPAVWCDYSGKLGDKSAGITLMASPRNFRQSWWHNRDYGLMVANPFGREAMKQGEKSSIEVPKGQSLQVCFGALIHDGIDVDFAAEFDGFAKLASEIEH